MPAVDRQSKRELETALHRMASTLLATERAAGDYKRDGETAWRELAQARSALDLAHEQLAEARRQCDLYRPAWEREQDRQWAAEMGPWRRLLRALGARP